MSCLEQTFFETEDTETYLYTRYYPFAYKYLLRLTNDSMQAEDLSQDALVVVIRHFREGRLHSLDELNAYVSRVARSLWIGRLRRSENSRLIYLETLDTAQLPASSGQEESTTQTDDSDKQYRIALLKVLSSLSTTRDRDILIRYFVYEQNKNQICTVLSLTGQQFDRVLSRARARLRTQALRMGQGNLLGFIAGLLED